MNVPLVNQIAKAVLYEGYMLYPYRPSSIKNRQRWNFGVVYPSAYHEAEQGNEASSFQAECLVSGSSQSRLAVSIRFLHLLTRSTVFQSAQGSLPETWQEAIEREVSLEQARLADLDAGFIRGFTFPADMQSAIQQNSRGDNSAFIVRQQEAVTGTVELRVEPLASELFKVRVVVRNNAPLPNPAVDRQTALLYSMVSTHIVLQLAEGSFISLLEPPDQFSQQAADCHNVGVWPVLVGEPGQRDTLLASPIILYDYPTIAPESAGDLFDGTEIDEILSLRIITLTDEEKQEIRRSDDRARQILERTDAMPAEQFLKLHGVVRGMRPLSEENQ